jgi:arylsulfatase A-like enzyme
MTNVLIYVVDALRADHLGCYGYARTTTPALDALAAETGAVRFSRAFSPSTWTKPVAASLLSGCFPPAHGVRTRSDLFLRGVPRLPELLQQAGYRTAGVSTIGNVSSSLGFAVGFDDFVDLYKDPILARHREVSNTGAWKLYFEEDTTVVLPLAEDVNECALTWLEEARRDARPWFLFLWVLDPHDPYYPPRDFDAWSDPGYQGRIDGSAQSVRQVRSQADVQQLIDLYDGEIAYVDRQFGDLQGKLREWGLYDDTLVLVAGDHGEAFGEHGDFVHGHLPYEEVMAVPLIIKLPVRDGQARPTGGRVCDDLAQLTDVAPTVLDVLGLGELTSGMQGRSLLPNMDRAGRAGWGLSDNASWSSNPRPAIYAETQSSEVTNRLLAVRKARWKYLRVDPPVRAEGLGLGRGRHKDTWRHRWLAYWRQGFNREMLRKLLRNPLFYLRRQMVAREMLFDLEADPQEQHNVLEHFPEVAAEMREDLEAWLAECRAYATMNEQSVPGLGLDEATQRQLEGLGYL